MLVPEYRDALEELAATQVFIWVPGHRRVERNERVNVLAKQVSFQGSVVLEFYLGLSQSWERSEVKGNQIGY